MSKMPDDIDRYYDTLEVGPGATQENVRQAYRDLLMVWHPDRFPSNPRLQTKAQEKTIKINNAYEKVRSLFSGKTSKASAPSRSHQTKKGAGQKREYSKWTDEPAGVWREPDPYGREHREKNRKLRRGVFVSSWILFGITIIAGINKYGDTEQARLLAAKSSREAKTGVTQTNQKRDILDVYKEAAQTNRRNPIVHYRLGETYSRMGLHREALGAFRDAVKFKPDYADAYYQLGLTYERIGNHDQAVEVLKQAVRFEPDNALAHAKLGRAYLNLGDYREAKEAYKRAIQGMPEYAVAYNGLGEALLLSGDTRSALEVCKIIKVYDMEMADELSRRIRWKS